MLQMIEISQPSPTMDRSYIKLTERPNALAASDDFEMGALAAADNYRKALLSEFFPFLRRNVLEVGAGIGQITEALLANNNIERCASIEPNSLFYDQLSAKFPGHRIIHGTIEDLRDDADWDALVSINVLEHIREDEGELKSYHRHLDKNHGVLCLFVPARMEIYGQLDRDFGHFRRYAKPELRQKLEQAGFEILRLRYYNLAGYFAWWLNIRLLRKRHFNTVSVRFFDRFIFPWVHAFESRFCPPFLGQSLLALARAKSGP